MSKEIINVLLMEKDNQDPVKSVLTHIMARISKRSNVDDLYNNLKQYAFLYLNETFQKHNYLTADLKTTFYEHLTEKTYSTIILEGARGLRHLTNEIIAYIIMQTTKVKNVDSFILLVLLIDSKHIETFLPGICMFCFRILELDCLNYKVIYLLAYILSKDIAFAVESENIISSYFLKKTEASFIPIWYILTLRFESNRKHFVSRLILNRIPLDKKFYRLINENINEFFSVELVKRLIELDEFEFNDEAFQKIRKAYETNGEHEYLLIKIQEKYKTQIKTPIYELLPTCKHNTKLALSKCCANRINKYLRRVNLTESGFEIAKFYLLNEDLNVNKAMENEIDVISVVKNNENKIFEWLFVKVEQSVMKYEEISDKVDLLHCKIPSNDAKTRNSEPVPDIDYHNSSLRAMKFSIELDLLHLVFVTLKFNAIIPTSDLQDIIYSFLSIFYAIDNQKLALEMLVLVKTVLFYNGDLKRNFLKYVFNEIIYFDIDCCKIRICKYEILNILLFRWFFIEESIKQHKEKALDSSKLNLVEQIKNIHLPTYDRYIILTMGKLPIKNSKELDSVNLNKENILVLCAKIWKELSVEIKNIEIDNLVELLKTIILLTGTFYEKRFTSSKLFKRLAEYYDPSISKYRNSKSYIELLIIIINSFYCSEDCIKIILESIVKLEKVKGYGDILDLLIRKHQKTVNDLIFIKDAIKIDVEAKKKIQLKLEQNFNN
ncbi:hypothetical protein NGRA_0371 [Nosema granulosis]|uniref:Uncharacterized protein n=1 Tax=Nosema granulosis TaxID=83296 RepID=A0A9P6H364_9MICR|nr:hypothetical protein NGRA_0371 [Nosema granulosis]